MTNFYQINAWSGDHMIYWLIERMAIIDHYDNNQSINWLNHNQFTALLVIIQFRSQSSPTYILIIIIIHYCETSPEVKTVHRGIGGKSLVS